ncbi:hypothetical protein EFR01_50790 [Sinorhizobium fredii]|nr:hypothetical protein EFR01_50790 [Sinorhizobium fredii]GLS07408.1 hypothetical protein GCM10007864_10350 [Sinorhizobium fredii]
MPVSARRARRGRQPNAAVMSFEQRAAVQELLAIQPKSSIEQFKAAAPTRHVPRFFEQALEGLRQAGFPEK